MNLRIFRRDWVWAVGAGAAQTVAFEHTWAWPLPVLAVAWLVSRLNRLNHLNHPQPRAAGLLAGAFGVGWLCAGVWWLFVSMHRFGQLPAWLAALAVLALALALSVYLAVAGACYAAWRTGRPGWDAALFAALWTLAECARGLLWTGFPWVASGYAWVDSPWAALAPWVGVYGLGAVLAATAAMAAWGANAWGAAPERQTTPHARRWWVIGGWLGITGLLAATGPASFTQPAGRISVSLIQTHVAQDEKFLLDRVPAALTWLSDALRQSPGQLVVTPETAVPLLPSQMQDLAPGWWEAQVAFFKQPQRAALVGVPLGDFASGYTNSVVGLTDAPAPYRYDKHHLVPFGEFIPPGFRWFTELMNLPLGDFDRGRRGAPSFFALGQRLAPNICYEDLFGEELAARFQVPELAPTVLVNVSNIAWFGHTVALPQHLHITRMRTLELQRPMLRATNTGMTAVVDHTGRVVQALPPFSRGSLHGEVEGQTGLTPYAYWAGRWGLWPWVALALVVVWWVRRLRFKGRQIST